MHSAALSRNLTLRVINALGVPPSFVLLLLRFATTSRDKLVDAWGALRKAKLWPMTKLAVFSSPPLFVVAWLATYLLAAESFTFVWASTFIVAALSLLVLADLAEACEHTVYVQHARLLVLFGRLFAAEDEQAWQDLGLELHPRAVNLTSLLRSAKSALVQAVCGNLQVLHQDTRRGGPRSSYAMLVAYLRALEYRKHPWRACMVGLWLVLCLVPPASATLDWILAALAWGLLLLYPSPAPGDTFHNPAVVCSFEVTGLVKLAAWLSRVANRAVHQARCGLAATVHRPPAPVVLQEQDTADQRATSADEQPAPRQVEWINLRGLANRSRLLMLVLFRMVPRLLGPEFDRFVVAAAGTGALVLLQDDLTRNHGLYFEGLAAAAAAAGGAGKGN